MHVLVLCWREIVQKTEANERVVWLGYFCKGDQSHWAKQEPFYTAIDISVMAFHTEMALMCRDKKEKENPTPAGLVYI